jgi:hypothetical protein
MRRVIHVHVGAVMGLGELHDSPTAHLIWEALPIRGQVQRWGDEVYFAIPVTTPLDSTARELVRRGDIGYWPQELALRIFFGQTPVSHGDEIRPTSAVNLMGIMRGDLMIFKNVQDGMAGCLEKEREVTI